MVVTSRDIVSKVRTWQHSRVEPKERDQPFYLRNSKRRKGVREVGGGPGSQGLSTHCPGVACLPQASQGERVPPAIWGPPPELCCVLTDGASTLWEWWPKRGSRGRI